MQVLSVDEEIEVEDDFVDDSKTSRRVCSSSIESVVVVVSVPR